MKSEDITVEVTTDGPFKAYKASLRSLKFEDLQDLSVTYFVDNGEEKKDPLLQVASGREGLLRKEIIWARRSELLALIDTACHGIYRCSECGESYTRHRAPKRGQRSYCPSCRTDKKRKAKVARERYHEKKQLSLQREG